MLPQFYSTLIFRYEEGILFLCSVLYAWYSTFILWKCVPIKLTVKNLPPRNAAVPRRRLVDVEVICEHAAEAVAMTSEHTTRWLDERLATPKVKAWKISLQELTLPATYTSLT